MNNQIFLLSLDSIKIKCWFNYCFLKNYTFHKLDCEQSPGWSCERGNGAKRVKVKNKKPRGSSPSAISLSPVLPNLDSTDWRGTACSLSTSRPQNFLFSSFFVRVECRRVLKFKPKETVACTPFCQSVQQTWPLKKHDGQTEVSVQCAVIKFLSLAFVSLFAFAVCLFQLLFWLKAMKNAIVNGRKRVANTIEYSRQE